MGIEKHFLRR